MILAVTDAQWQVVGLAAGIATAAATVFSLLFSWLWRFMDRRRVAWVSFGGRSVWIAEENDAGAPSADVEVANVGDGAAFEVRVVGLGCHVRLQGPPVKTRTLREGRDNLHLIPVVHPGDDFHLELFAEAADWERAAVALVWTASPMWRRRRRVSLLPLATLAERPKQLRRTFSQENGQYEFTELPATGDRVLPEKLAATRPVPPLRRHWIARRRVIRGLRRSM